MSKPRFGTFTDLASTTTAGEKDVSELEEVAVLVGGTFVGTVDVLVSFDGTTFVPHPTLNGKTAPFSGTIGFRCKMIDIECTAYTSGTIKSGFSGSDEDLQGA